MCQFREKDLKNKSVEVSKEKCMLIQSALDSLSAHIAILDEEGIIRYTNKAWKDFARTNGLSLDECCEGTDYLRVTRDSEGRPGELTRAIEQVIQGKKEIYTEEYPCHGPENQRWFRLKVTPFIGDGPYAAVISHENITEKKLSELKVEESLRKTRRLHDQFLPRDYPDISGFDFSSFYQPANRLGGDFYHFIEINRHLIFYVSDVSGHDISSAMLNIFLREAVNSYLLSHSSGEELNPTHIMDYLGERYHQEDFPADYFISLFLGVLDLETRVIKAANAGFQYPPFLIREGKYPAALNCSGMPISYLRSELDDTSCSCSFELAPGDILLTFTDGLIEQSSGEEDYSEKRLADLIIQTNTSDAENLIRAIRKDFSQFKGSAPLQDDLTLLALKRTE